jgi:hypothetical protein
MDAVVYESDPAIEPTPNSNANSSASVEPVSGRDALGQFRPGNPYGFKPGESGSARGRRDSLLDHLRRLGEETQADGQTRNQVLAQSLWDLAIGKASQRIKLAAIEQIFDRLHGRPSQSVRLGVGPEQLSDGEIVTQVQATLVERGISLDEAQRFLLALGVGDDSEPLQVNAGSLTTGSNGGAE